MAQTRSLNLPEELYERLALKAEVDQGDGASDERIIELLRHWLERSEHAEELPSIPPQEQYFSVEDVASIRSAAKRAPVSEIVRLARPDGEMQHVSFRLSADTAAWLEETQRVLSILPNMAAFYGKIDRSTAIRHTLAAAVLLEMPLDVIPPKGGDSVSVNLPQELFQRLSERAHEIVGDDGRAKEGVSTVVRHVLAASMERGRRSRENRQQRRQT